MQMTESPWGHIDLSLTFAGEMVYLAYSLEKARKYAVLMVRMGSFRRPLYIIDASDLCPGMFVHSSHPLVWNGKTWPIVEYLSVENADSIPTYLVVKVITEECLSMETMKALDPFFSKGEDTHEN